MSNPDIQHTEKDLEDMMADMDRTIWEREESMSDCRKVEAMLEAVRLDAEEVEQAAERLVA